MTAISGEKLDLGCGERKRPDAVGVDIAETDDVDVVQDLDAGEWDLPEDTFSDVQVHHVYEHLENPVQFMENLWEVCVDGASVEIVSPHVSSQNWHDPTHKRLLGSKSFVNFTEDAHFPFYSDVRFE